MHPRAATVALSAALLVALCALISATTLLFAQSAIDDQSHCTTAADCNEEDNPSTLHHQPHRETMSNADKFIEMANGEFPDGALPDQQEYEHPLVKRYVCVVALLWRAEEGSTNFVACNGRQYNHKDIYLIFIIHL